MKARAKRVVRLHEKMKKRGIKCGNEKPTYGCAPHKCGKFKFHPGKHGECEVANSCSEEW